jgi:hypothetical protein
LLCLEASRARVSQCSLKTGGGVARMVHVAYHRGHVEMKLKMDGSMPQVPLDSSTSTLLFSLY